MTLINKLMFFVEWSVKLAALVGLGSHEQVMCFDSGGESSSYSKVIRKQNKQLNERTGSDWLSARNSVDGTPMADETLLWKSIEGFFGRHRQGQNSKKMQTNGHRRNQTKYNSSIRETEKNETEVLEDPITVTANNPTKTVFGTENECVSANDGRPCVCYMADFMDLVCRRLDEEVVNPNDDNTDKMFACPSYKVVPTEFVISSSMATVKVPMTSATTMAHVLGQCTEEYNFDKVGPAWKQVDFNKIINYQLEKPKDGKITIMIILVVRLGIPRI